MLFNLFLFRDSMSLYLFLIKKYKTKDISFASTFHFTFTASLQQLNLLFGLERKILGYRSIQFSWRLRLDC